MSGKNVEIRIGLGSCGIAGGAEAVRAAVVEETRKAGGGAVVKAVGCNGMCHRDLEVIEMRARCTATSLPRPREASSMARPPGPGPASLDSDRVAPVRKTGAAARRIGGGGDARAGQAHRSSPETGEIDPATSTTTWPAATRRSRNACGN
jgi:hypothetical protein